MKADKVVKAFAAAGANIIVLDSPNDPASLELLGMADVVIRDGKVVKEHGTKRALTNSDGKGVSSNRHG